MDDGQEWLKQRCLELGAQQFLKKPVKQEELCTALQDIFLVRTTEEVS
jgi:CheY-like chemotaxis protein